MEQRRQTARVATLQEAQIVLACGGHLDCTIENVSATGLRLRVADAARVPPVFDLAFSGDGEVVRCHVAWVGNDHLGAAFEDPVVSEKAA